MRQRQGFTLVEMLVAMALTLFVMTILSQAFIAGLDTFRGLKAIGDMDEGLRTTVNNLRADLLLDHLVDATGKPIRLKSLVAPSEGFFRIEQGANGPAESTDWESISTYPNATMSSFRQSKHVLHFSVKASGSRPENFFIAAVKPTPSRLLASAIDFVYPTGQVTPYRSGDTVSSQWAELAYWLEFQGSTAAPNNPAAAINPPTGLYKLYRTQYLVAANNTSLNNGTMEPIGDRALYYKTVSCQADTTDPTKLWFNSPTDLKNSKRRFLTTDTDGRTLLLNNVVSFAVQIMKPGDTDFSDVGATPYDTSSATLPSSLSAVQISIRVWDFRTQGTRQITIIQDM